MRYRVVIAGLICWSCPAAFCEPAALKGEELSAVMPGATVKVDTPFGMQLPVQYNSNGQITGEAGGMAGFLGTETDHGRWWVDNDRLCHKWSRWFDREVQCLRITRDGQRLQWSRDDGQKGTATLITEMQPGEKAPFALGAADASAPAVMAPVVPPAPGVAAPPAVSPKPAEATGVPKRAAPVRTASAAAMTIAAAKPAAIPPSTPKHVVAARAAVAAPSYRISGVAANDVLHIRQSPSAASAVVGDIAPQSQSLRLAGVCVKDWCPIMHKGTRGWVGKFYLAEEIAAAGQPRR